MKVLIIRRPKLGRTSCKEIARKSSFSVKTWRNDNQRRKLSWIARDCEDLTHIVRWGCTSRVPQELGGPEVILNSAPAIEEVNDKMGFRAMLQQGGAACPKTWLIPSVPDLVVGPPDPEGRYIARPSHHAQGKQLFVGSFHECADWIRARHGNVGYISEYIEKVAEYRVFVVQGRAVCVAKKTPGNPNDVAWNVARGGRFDNVLWEDWPLRAVKEAINAFLCSRLDFGGVDVMVDSEGAPYVLEINSAPSLTSPYRQECMAKAIDYMVVNGSERIPLKEEKGGWKKFIHPAISEDAEQ